MNGVLELLTKVSGLTLDQRRSAQRSTTEPIRGVTVPGNPTTPPEADPWLSPPLTASLVQHPVVSHHAPPDTPQHAYDGLGQSSRNCSRRWDSLKTWTSSPRAGPRTGEHRTSAVRSCSILSEGRQPPQASKNVNEHRDSGSVTRRPSSTWWPPAWAMPLTDCKRRRRRRFASWLGLGARGRRLLAHASLLRRKRGV
jgi:hypothetical protein